MRKGHREKMLDEAPETAFSGGSIPELAEYRSKHSGDRSVVTQKGRDYLDTYSVILN